MKKVKMASQVFNVRTSENCPALGVFRVSLIGVAGAISRSLDRAGGGRVGHVSVSVLGWDRFRCVWGMRVEWEIIPDPSRSMGIWGLIDHLRDLGESVFDIGEGTSSAKTITGRNE